MLSTQSYTLLAIPGYRLLDCLQTRASSIIYRAVRLSDERPVVIKLSTQKALSEKKIQRFRREFEIGQQIHSPHVVNYLELKQDLAFGLALVMEDDNAVELTSVIPAQGFSNLEFLEIAIQFVQGLQAIHAANIIHNDIKPSNVLIQPKTKIIKIIDFNRASTVRQEMQPPISMMIGSLAYISPEQTGRINRSVDYRTDFYSLGVTFYQLLCGQLPFISNDTLGLIHQHLAKQPESPHLRKSTIALPLSQMVMKLLEKEAENRYQSCEGILHDLTKCQLALDKQTGTILAFKLGQQDFSNKLTLSEHLYGRENEMKTLLQAYERIGEGKSEVLMVAGQPGVGKSRLIQEIQKPITIKRGYFLTGKFDQLNKNVAYSALTQAFNGLIKQLLTEDEASISQWKTQLQSALGSHAQLIVQVAPTLTSFMGQQPPVTIADINQAKTVFNLAFVEFIQVFTNEHPLVLFLDDLQWADSASLELISYLMQQPKISQLLLIGAYRDTEVTVLHPAMQTIAALQEAQVSVRTLMLTPLSFESLRQWIADSLHMPLAEVSLLADLIQQKTAGNPFFVKMFLQALHDQQLLTFSRQANWQWDLDKIRQHPATENVISLMTYQILQLPAITQEALSIASCLGHRVMLSTLETAMECSQQVVFEALQPVLNSGILIKSDSEVHFAHDRVQEAAYNLLSVTHKAQTHLTIGRRLLTHFSTEEAWLLDIVAQFNRCHLLVTDAQERMQMARLNLKAGQKAKQATAYVAALDYLYASQKWIDTQVLWQTDYALAFTFHKELAETEYLNGHIEISQSLITDMLPRLQSILDKVDIYHLLIIQKIVQGQQQEAIAFGNQALQLLGTGLPLDNPKAFIQREMPLLKQKLAAILLPALLDAPIVNDLEKQAIFKILADLSSACYQIGSELLPAITLMSINFSLTYGHAPESCLAYVVYGLLLCVDCQEYALGYEYGNLAIQLSEQLRSPVQRCRSELFMLDFIYGWSKSIQLLPAKFASAFDACLACGEIEYAGYCGDAKVHMMFDAGSNLSKVQQEIIANLRFAQSTKTKGVIFNVMRGYQKVVANLTGESQNERDFSYQNVSDVWFEEDCQKSTSGMALGLYYIRKSQALYHYGHFAEGLDCLSLARNQLACIRGFYATAVFNWYDSLSRLALYPTVHLEVQKIYLQQVVQNQQQMLLWQASCPENFAHKYFLVEAEVAQLKSNSEQALAYYGKAIDLAGRHGFIQEQALAAELAAKYWLARGIPLCAQGYLNTAFNGYKQWGAKRKLMQFKARYSDLLHDFASPSLTQLEVNQETTLSSNTLKFLDLSSILKASHAISSEIELPKLLRSMMQIIIENAGAQKGSVLFIEADGTINVQAEYAVDGTITTLQKIPLANWTNGAYAVIQYVKRLHQTVVVDDATSHAQFKTDSYISKMQVKSILCIPLLKQEQLSAILYVENNLMPNAFTPERVQTVQILTAQMTISLENARYFAEQIALTRQLAEQSARTHIAEESLHAVTHDLQLALQASKAGTWNWWLGADNVVTWDAANCALFGLTPGEFNGTYVAFLERVHPDDRERITDNIERCIKQDIPYDVEFRVIWPDSSQHVISTHGRVYRDKNNQPIKMAGVCLDITQRRLLEQQRLEALKQAEEKERQRAQEAEKHLKEREKFTDTICHEIRNPLSAIYGNVNLLKDTFTDLKAIQSTLPVPIQPAQEGLLRKQEECIQVIELCLEHQQAIVDNVLNLSKLALGKKVLTSKPFQPKILVENTVRMFEPQLAAKHLAVQLSLPKTAVIIRSDPDRFTSILMNLVSNAIKFTKQGQIRVSLETKVITPTQTALTLCVEDTGVGMTPEQQSLLFQRFSQPVSSQYGGSGLGLLITKNTIGLMGGTIDVESEKGHGSKFTVKLICESIAPEASMSPLIARKPASPQSALSLGSKYILVVEDNVVNQKIFKNQLERAGHRCIVANNGQEALEKCEQDTFDLIFMDREMPVMDGLQATKKIRAREKELRLAQTPIIGLSAYARADLIEEGLAAGMNAYLTKPYKTEQIHDAIKQWGKRETTKSEELPEAIITAAKERAAESPIPPVKMNQEASALRQRITSSPFWSSSSQQGLSPRRTWMPEPLRLYLYPILDLLSAEIQSLGITIAMPAERFQDRSSKTGWQLYAITGKDEYWAVLNLAQETDLDKLVKTINQCGARVNAKKMRSGTVPAIAITFSSQITLSAEINNIKRQIRNVLQKVSSRLS